MIWSIRERRESISILFQFFLFALLYIVSLLYGIFSRPTLSVALWNVIGCTFEMLSVTILVGRRTVIESLISILELQRKEVDIRYISDLCHLLYPVGFMSIIKASMASSRKDQNKTIVENKTSFEWIRPVDQSKKKKS